MKACSLAFEHNRLLVGDLLLPSYELLPFWQKDFPVEIHLLRFESHSPRYHVGMIPARFQCATGWQIQANSSDRFFYLLQWPENKIIFSLFQDLIYLRWPHSQQIL